ncbi:hypothetical protein HDU93_008034 [Gonapodya sp. JEL0774]|nr:hypothetical protein HDU93_008034 [Gonapodya sp. JEL0774]
MAAPNTAAAPPPSSAAQTVPAACPRTRPSRASVSELVSRPKGGSPPEANDPARAEGEHFSRPEAIDPLPPPEAIDPWAHAVLTLVTHPSPPHPSTNRPPFQNTPFPNCTSRRCTASRAGSTRSK